MVYPVKSKDWALLTLSVSRIWALLTKRRDYSIIHYTLNVIGSLGGHDNMN